MSNCLKQGWALFSVRPSCQPIATWHTTPGAGLARLGRQCTSLLKDKLSCFSGTWAVAVGVRRQTLEVNLHNRISTLPWQCNATPVKKKKGLKKKKWRFAWLRVSCLKLIQVDAETNYSSSANISSSCDVVMAMVFRKLEMFTDTNMGALC